MHLIKSSVLGLVKHGRSESLIVLLFLCCPVLAYANAGLPMLAVVWPLSLPAFIPVVLVESWVIQRELGIGWRFVFAQVIKANLLTTVIGIPLSWLALAALEIFCVVLSKEVGLSDSYPPPALGRVAGVILSAPWLGPFTEGGYWITPLATTVLLVPFFFASYHIESWYVSESLVPSAPKRGQRALWKANLLSYAMLMVSSISWLALNIATYGED